MAAPAFLDLFGDTLAKGDKTIPTMDALEGKTAVGLYFSAHWCPPCRGFTPSLVSSYSEHLQKKGMEIIFVSSDREEPAFKDYYGSMPWLALPYNARDLKAKLSKKFKVQGIPAFIVLDGATGELITSEGRDMIASDPTGKEYPWKPPGFWEAMGSEFLSGTDGETVDVDELKSSAKVIGLYFSAHWCPPCRSFTPSLVSSYSEHLKAKGLEIIFVSSDRDQASFMDYYKTMPWLAIPNGDKRKDALSRRFGVEGIPMLVFVDAATGETISTEVRGRISSDPTGKEFPYHPKPVNDMVSDGPGDINDEPTLCVMMEGCAPDVQAAALAALEPIAKASKEKKADMSFLYAFSSGGPTPQVRQLTKLGEPTATPQLLLIDIPDGGGFYVSPATEVTADTVSAFLEGYAAKSLERKQLS